MCHVFLIPEEHGDLFIFFSCQSGNFLSTQKVMNTLILVLFLF